MSKSTITVRNLRFPLTDTPKYWLGGQRSVSMLLDHLSIVFPPGESFFMTSVRAFEGQVQEHELRAAMRGFHAQEALHGREHAHYNQRLQTLGYPVRSIDRSARRILWLGKALFSRRGQLGITAALEHFTALLAQVALGDNSFLKKADPEMDALWRWHAAEENEHAAVAFDVFKAVGGGYGLRMLTMVLATVFFLLKVSEHQLRMMWADRILFSLREWRGLYRFLFRDPAIVRRVFRPYLQYYRRDFHPHQIDTGSLLADWQQEFVSAPIYQQRVYVPAKRNAARAEPA